MADDCELEILTPFTESSIIRKGWKGLQNNEILVFFGGIVLSGMSLVLANFLPWLTVIPLAIAPVTLCSLYVFLFMHGKPPHCLMDTIEGAVTGNRYQPFSKVYNHCPDGMLYRHLILWDSLTNGVWSCGMELDVPALDYAKNRTKNHFLRGLGVCLNVFAKEGLRVQIVWSVDSNYSSELADYAADTARLPEGSPCRVYRELRSKQYQTLCAERRLRREKARIYVSRALSSKERLTWDKSLRDYDYSSKKLLRDLENKANNIFTNLRSMFGVYGIGCRALGEKDNLSILKVHFNPTISLEPRLFRLEHNRDLSIREQVVHSDLTGRPETGAAFMLDGQYYNVIVLKSPLPASLQMGSVEKLTTRLYGTLDYELVLNVIPRDAAAEKAAEDKAVEVLTNQVTTGGQVSLRFELQKHVDYAEELSGDRALPLDVQYFIYVHALTMDELTVKTASIISGITDLKIGFYSLCNPMSAINAFFQGTPGWLYGARDKHSFKTLDKYLAALLPLSSTYTGMLSNAEAIYNGEQNNLVGVKQFAKEIFADSDPQHTLLFGKTGSGKSVLTADLIMQTHGFYDYTCIIDYGLSYKELAARLGYAPVYLGPSSNITINYLDTQGFPLTGEHLSFAATILRVMSDGRATDGMIMRYLKPFYLSCAGTWLDERNGDTALMHELAAKAYLMDKYLRERKADDEIEAYKLAGTDWASYPFDQGDLDDYICKHPDEIRYQCFALMKPEEFNTHTQFVNYIRSKPLDDEEDFKALQETADLLELWEKGGKNGRLFDGITNLDMSGDFQYFELSGVPSNDPNFKFAAGALIMMMAGRKIERGDRKKKKRFIVDETNSLFEIPQGVKLVENALTKFRKHRCSVLLSFQQFEMLKQAGVREAITSNIHQYLLMGQTDSNDVKQLAEALELSDPIASAIMAFETPANLPEESRYSAFAQVVKTRGTVAGIGRNAMSKELLNMIGCK